MKIHDYILLAAIYIFSLTVRVSGRAIPDFYTDKDIEAWHKFGLRSFYGPWSVIARKPNGDLISYADYGSVVPSDFHPITTETINDAESNAVIDDSDDDEKHSNSRSEFLNIATDDYSSPRGLEALATGIPDLDSLSSLLGKSRSSIDDNDEEEQTEDSTSDRRSNVDEKDKRDTLELIGIVGVITEENDDSLENSKGTAATTENGTDSHNDNSSITNDS